MPIGWITQTETQEQSSYLPGKNKGNRKDVDQGGIKKLSVPILSVPTQRMRPGQTMFRRTLPCLLTLVLFFNFIMNVFKHRYELARTDNEHPHTQHPDSTFVNIFLYLFHQSVAYTLTHFLKYLKMSCRCFDTSPLNTLAYTS